MQVDLNKKYRTRDGREVMLYHIHHDSQSLYPVHGAVKFSPAPVWSIQSWTLSGGALKNYTQAADLVEVSPYEDFKIDDPVLLPNGHHAHFAGIDSHTGYPQIFSCGGTSWSTPCRETVSHVHRPEE